MGFHFLRCKCKAIFDAWAELTGDTFSVKNLVRKVGEPSSSVDEFTLDDNANYATYVLAMQRLSRVFLVERNAGATLTSVANYHATTGALQWNHTTSTMIGTTAAYNVSGAFPTGNFLFVNETQAWHGGTKQLFESTGVTVETAAVNYLTNPYDPTVDPEWVPNILSSHDFPRCACYRVRFENPVFGAHTGTFFISGMYYHLFAATIDTTIEIGIGDYDVSTGLMSGVTVVDSFTHNVDKNPAIWSASPTPPLTPAWEDVAPDSLTGGGPGYVQRGGATLPPSAQRFVSHFSSIGSNWVLAYGFRKVGRDEYRGYERVVINGDVIYEWSSTVDVDLSPTLSVAAVHDTPSSSGYADILISYEDGGVVYLEGWNTSPSLDWQQACYANTNVLSVNDTWALVYSPVTKASQLGYDGRNWENVTGLTTLNYWMVKLDNSEWEPTRIEASATSWTQHSILAVSSQQIDLVKTVSHPASPPEDSYETTPP